MTIKEFLKEKIFGKKSVAKVAAAPEYDTFINNRDEIRESRLAEYNVWYGGDGDELLNFYTDNVVIGFNYEPYYSRNKKNYFWAISSTESDIKRTHSGQPRNIVDTLVGICRFPTIKSTITQDGSDKVATTLKEIIDECGLEEIYKQEQLPLTLVDGWGCYKINWDDTISEYPYPVYYRAKDVDFIYKNGKIVSIVFKDYYTTENGSKQYMLTETRSIKYDSVENTRYLAIEYELFRMSGESLRPATKEEVPELAELENVKVSNCDMLLAVPCIIYRDVTNGGGYGRSIFTGKIDLFDDLDQCLSQSSNAVRKSTPIEYINSEFLERDKNGMPIQPKAYDRKYTVYKGGINGDGETSGMPVMTTQPKLDFAAYSSQAIDILLQIVNGIMSPATLGIDISKKDNAEAQREKEKVTIFTRNGIIDSETKILKNLCSQLLCANELKQSGLMTVNKYNISVKYSEFADDSFENKLEKLGAALDSQCISEDMYMEKLYGDTLSNEEYQREKQWLEEHHTKPHDAGMLGIAGGGSNFGKNFGGNDEEEI